MFLVGTIVFLPTGVMEVSTNTSSIVIYRYIIHGADT